jgi:pre-mRNA-splicing factor CWC22
VNKVSAQNIQSIVPDLFAQNLVRGRGLFCRSLLKSQAASPNFTDVYAATLAVVNTKMPEIGELALKRLIVQFRKAYRRNAKDQCLAAVRFIAHLANQQVCGIVLPLELLALLLERPTDDSVELAVAFVRECGKVLADVSPQGFNGVFERFRAILHEGRIDKRVQYLIEALFAVRKTGFAGVGGVPDALDLVEADDQITHDSLSLEDELDVEDALNYFHFDPQFAEHEKMYESIRNEILGEADDAAAPPVAAPSAPPPTATPTATRRAPRSCPRPTPPASLAVGQSGAAPTSDKIQDATSTNIVAFRRTIYLTIMSSLSFEECAHKLLKMGIDGLELEVANMIVECCSQERTYLRFYGLLGERFCKLRPQAFQAPFDEVFVKWYSTIHRLETNKLRNCAKFFGHLLHSDALLWTVLYHIKLNEDDTTSSSRIFIKILFNELAEYLGLARLKQRLEDPSMAEAFAGVFPRDNPRNTRFAINFFTSIGLGRLTDGLREHLKNAPQQMAAVPIDDDDSSSSSSSSYSSSSSSGRTLARTRILRIRRPRRHRPARRARRHLHVTKRANVNADKKKSTFCVSIWHKSLRLEKVVQKSELALGAIVKERHLHKAQRRRRHTRIRPHPLAGLT